LNNITNKISIQTTDGYIFFDPNEIYYIKSEDIYAYVYDASEEHFVNDSLKALESKLTSEKFFRCHRSYIVNLDKIKRLVKSANCHVILDNKIQVPVARNKKSEIIELLIKNMNHINEDA